MSQHMETNVHILATRPQLLSLFFQAQNNPKLVDYMMKDLDLNKDDKLDFEEFLPLFVGLSLACEKCYIRTQKKTKK